MGGEFLEGEFFRGLFGWKKQSQKIRLKNSGPKFGSPKFVSQNSALNSGSGGAKSPVQTCVSDYFFRGKSQKKKRIRNKNRNRSQNNNQRICRLVYKLIPCVVARGLWSVPVSSAQGWFLASLTHAKLTRNLGEKKHPRRNFKKCAEMSPPPRS